mmetsp:Transcript_37884/g.86685  ORF Transcript_37884/g.86685 Transcript_37884/m.86685 type:complete len:90 (+) Transcript_37884:2173-2442(+)
MTATVSQRSTALMRAQVLYFDHLMHLFVRKWSGTRVKKRGEGSTHRRNEEGRARRKGLWSESTAFTESPDSHPGAGPGKDWEGVGGAGG